MKKERCFAFVRVKLRLGIAGVVRLLLLCWAGSLNQESLLYPSSDDSMISLASFTLSFSQKTTMKREKCGKGVLKASALLVKLCLALKQKLLAYGFVPPQTQISRM